MKNIIKALVIPFIFFISSCSSSDEEIDGKIPDAEPITLRSGLENKIIQSNEFALDLFKSAYNNSKNESNIFISPLSVSMALSMTLNGATGDTYSEIEKTLHSSGCSIDDINEFNKSLRDALLKVDPSTQFSIANSIWYRLGFNVENSFIQTNRNSFNAEVKALDISDPASVDKINQWCADNTNNKIPKIMDKISDVWIMSIINAVYFKGSWRSRFPEQNTQSGTFYAEDNTVQKVPMMNQQGIFYQSSDQNCSYLELPYGNWAFSMILMLPVEGKTVADVLDNLNVNLWDNNRYLNNIVPTTPVEVNLTMPRFTAQMTYKLHEEVLRDMGMNKSFTPELAEFKGINKNRDLYISEVLHKTFIEVNEEGSEAAAVTSVNVGITSVGPNPLIVDYVVNKPFLFAIKEKSTGVILFMGKIGEIK